MLANTVIRAFAFLAVFSFAAAGSARAYCPGEGDEPSGPSSFCPGEGDQPSGPSSFCPGGGDDPSEPTT